MNIKFRWAAAGLLAVLLVSAGCETTGGSQTQTTIYDIHRRMVKLDKELEGSVSKLNESTATLIARVDQSDEQTRTVRGLLEENQAKLDALSRELESMKTTLYRHWNLTTTGPAAGAPPSVSTGGPVTVERPATLQPQAPTPPTNELVDSAPLPTEPAAPTTVPTPAPATPAPAAATPANTTQPAPVADPAEYTSEPAVPATDSGDPRVLYQQAQRSYANDDFAGALGQFDTYLSQYPSNDLSANAQFWKAKCLFNLSRYQESVQAFEGLRSNFSTSTKVPFAMHNQAVAHSRLGQNKEAERLMEAVIDQYPVSPAADQARADLLKLRGGEQR
jgi:tol-pal system protein YbgF